MPIKHNKTNTIGVISNLRWLRHFPRPDGDRFQIFKHMFSQPAFLLHWLKQEDTTPYKAGHPSVCDALTDHPHIRMIWSTS